MDFPRAWEIARATPVEEHNPRCSYVQTDGAVLCDCDVLNLHPENDIPTTPPSPGMNALAAEWPGVEVWIGDRIVQAEDFEAAKALMKQAVKEGVFISDEEAIKEEAAWADQMESEMAVVPAESTEVAVVEQAEDYPEGIDPPVDPLDIPDHYDLPFHGSILSCPKCGGDQRTDDGKVKGLRTYYHQQGILHAPCGQRFGWPEVQNLGEHLCRVCEKCRYGWPEQVFHGEA